MKISICFLGFLIVLIFHQNNVLACDCGKGSIQYGIENNYLVVEGNIISKENFNFNDSSRYFQAPDDTDYNNPKYIPKTIAKYKLVVKKLFKGEIFNDTIVLFSALSVNNCGFEFEVGKRYIVYANKIKPIKVGNRFYSPFQVNINEFSTSRCSRNCLYEQNEIDEIKNYIINKYR